MTDPQYNASPLICPITEVFSSFSQASSGHLGAEFSRVAGGIHTPIAVENATTLGNAIGAALVPEPPILPVLGTGLLALGLVQSWRKRLLSTAHSRQRYSVFLPPYSPESAETRLLAIVPPGSPTAMHLTGTPPRVLAE